MTWEFLTQPIRVTTSSASLIPSGFFLESLLDYLACDNDSLVSRLDTIESLSQARLRVRACLNGSSRREREVSRDNAVRFPRVSLDGPSTSILSDLRSSIWLGLAWQAGSTGDQKTEDGQLVTDA